MTEVELLGKTLTPSYNCAHFLVDAWRYETGQDIGQTLSCFLAPAPHRRVDISIVRKVVPLRVPASPCIVLFRRTGATPHVGMFVRGRVLHLTDGGPIRQLLNVARVGYTSLRYYAPCPDQ